MALNLFTLGYLIACICVVILLPLVITGLLYLLYIAYIRLKFAHMPGPKYSSFFFGNLADVKRGFADGKTFPTIVYEWSQKYGLVFTFSVLHLNYVIISDVVAAKHLLVTVNCPKGATPYDTLSNIYGQRFLGHGLASERCHERWAKRRSIINPAFHRRFLRLSMDQFNASVDLLIDKLKKRADGKTTVSMLEEFYKLGLDIIGKVAFGTDFNVIFGVDNHFVEANQLILSALIRRLRFPLEDYNPWSRGHRQEVRAAIRFIRKMGRDVIEKRLATRLNGEEMKEDDVLGYILKASDYLKNPEFQMEDVVDDFFTFYLAGQETTANTAAFVLMELVRNQDILERVRKEIDNVLCGRTEVKFEDLAKFTFMSQVVRETLRIYPTAPAIPRFLEKEETVAGVRVPANSSINCPGEERQGKGPSAKHLRGGLIGIEQRPVPPPTRGAAGLCRRSLCLRLHPWERHGGVPREILLRHWKDRNDQGNCFAGPGRHKVAVLAGPQPIHSHNARHHHSGHSRWQHHQRHHKEDRQENEHQRLEELAREERHGRAC